MKRQKNLAGYTIIEVMLFLIISGALLTSVMTLISGQQQKTQFTTGTREFESKLQDIINDVETGYFPSANDLKCEVPGMYNDANAAPNPPTPSPSEQGTNQDCVFLGKAIQFYKEGPGTNIDKYRVVTIAGKRLDFNSSTNKTEEPANIAAASPIAFYESSSSTGLESGSVPYGIEVTKVRYVDSFSPFVTDDSFEELAIVPSVVLNQRNNISSNIGNGRLILAALQGDSNFNNDLPAFTTSITSLSNAGADKARLGSVICLRDGAGGRPAAIAIGIQLSQNMAGGFEPQPTSQQLATQTFLDEQARSLGCTS